MITIAVILLIAILVVLSVRYWPWRQEEVERGVDRWKERTTYGGVPIGDWRPQQANYVIYRITNRYTKSTYLRKVYLD